MESPQPDDGLLLVVARLLQGQGAWVGEAVRTACGLLVAGRDTPATVEVAALPSGTPLRDAEPLIRSMLEEQGVEAPPSDADVDSQFPFVQGAFARRLLPFADYYSVFYAVVPEWDKQNALQRRVIRLFDDWETETDPAEQDRIVERIRSAIVAEVG